jgi:hypothetical protein
MAATSSRLRIGLARIDQRSIRGDQAFDRPFILDALQPSPKLSYSLVGHMISLPRSLSAAS